MAGVARVGDRGRSWSGGMTPSLLRYLRGGGAVVRVAKVYAGVACVSGGREWSVYGIGSQHGGISRPDGNLVGLQLPELRTSVGIDGSYQERKMTLSRRRGARVEGTRRAEIQNLSKLIVSYSCSSSYCHSHSSSCSRRLSLSVTHALLPHKPLW